jgi:hypothetical protein
MQHSPKTPEHPHLPELLHRLSLDDIHMLDICLRGDTPLIDSFILPHVLIQSRKLSQLPIIR